MVFDFKKEFKDLYVPKTEPGVIDVPPMPFFMVDGAGNPNGEEGEYAEALEILYGLSYSVKMSKMGGHTPPGYFDYVMPPLEGFWSVDGYVFDGAPIKDKSKFKWTSAIRQPNFVTPEVFEIMKAALLKKKPGLAVEKARLEIFTEGLCVQVMHIGPYDNEPATIVKMEEFVVANGYVNDMAGARRHHEIYLGDPRKTAPEKLRTIIRHPVRKAGG